ncbi:hypothetical protein [Flavobacterium filum]|uniref:hypothetical protein n=1 Tax=Flavobacterium filum TaxID=370974 RepID=UPI0023F52204|nr:hypothetical protein [Flavobacterium filum]
MITATGCTTGPRENAIAIPPTHKTNEQVKEKPFANPALIYGSDFLSLVSAERMAGNNEELLRYTSRQSKIQFTSEQILKEFGKTNINLEKKLKSIRKLNDSCYTLNYLTNSFATKGIMTVNVRIEKDTCRILLPIVTKNFLD